MNPPDKKQREVCWTQRDLYFKCLTQNKEDKVLFYFYYFYLNSIFTILCFETYSYLYRQNVWKRLKALEMPVQIHGFFFFFSIIQLFTLQLIE